MRTQAEWKVDTHIFWATGPTRAATRCFISSAALLVKVMARISKGETPSLRMRWAMRWVSTRVLPDPAPATTSSGPSTWVTASSWTGLRPSVGSGRSGHEPAAARSVVVGPVGLEGGQRLVDVGRRRPGPRSWPPTAGGSSAASNRLASSDRGVMSPRCYWPPVTLLGEPEPEPESRERGVPMGAAQVEATGSTRRSRKKSSTWSRASRVGLPGSSTRCSVSTEWALLGKPQGLPGDESISTPMKFVAQLLAQALEALGLDERVAGEAQAQHAHAVGGAGLDPGQVGVG